MRFLAHLFLATALVAPSALVAQNNSGSDVITVTKRVKVELIHEVNIPAEASGKLTLSEGVDKGSSVSEGDILARIDDQQAALTVKLKEAEEAEQRLTAENDVNMRAAVKAQELAETIAKSYIEMYQQNAVPLHQRDEKVLEAESAELRVELAGTEQEKAKSMLKAKEAETDLARFALQQRQLKAPFGGVIFRKSVETGEWVEPGTPVLTIIDLETLKVVGDIDANTHDVQSLHGRPVTVVVRINSSETRKFPGRIRYVSPRVEVDGTTTIEAEIANTTENGRWVVIPGMSATINIHKDPQVAARN